MKRRLRALFLLAALALALPPALADDLHVDGVRVTCEGYFASGVLPRITHGTLVYTFTVANSTPTEKTVRITADGLGASGSVTVAPLAVSRLLLRVPHSSSLNNYVRASVSVDGKAWVPLMDFYASGYFTTRQTSYPVLEDLIGLSPSVPDIDGEMRSGRMPPPENAGAPLFTLALSNAFNRAVQPRHHSRIGLEFAGKISTSPVLWPTEWLAYSTFDALVIAPDDFWKMPVATRSALRDYVDAGGCLAFVGTEGDLGEVSATFPLPRGGEGVACGFGRVMLLHDLLPEAERLPISGERRRFAQTLMSRYGVWDPRRGPVLDKLRAIPIPNAAARTPVAALILLLVLFFLLGGPVALIVLARKNRRIWLYWVLPSFSVVVSGVIVLAVLFSEGTTPSVRLQSATILDQPARRAATIGAIGIYAPVGIFGGLAFPSTMDVSPLAKPSGATIACGARQLYSSAWAPARIPAFFRTREVGERHERLLVEERGDGTVEVVNALGAPISRLRLRSTDGILHGTESLQPGERRALSRVADPDAPSRKDNAAFAESLFAANGIGEPMKQGSLGWNLQAEPDLAALAVDKGSYCAILDGSPFLASPLTRGASHVSALSVVLGRYR